MSVVYRFGRAYSHGAIYIGAGMIIHALINQLVSEARIDEADLDGRARLIYRLRGVG